MLVEFIGGKMDGKIKDVPHQVGSTIKLGFSKPLTAAYYLTGEHETPIHVNYLIYRRKPDTNKFYFDKIEEV